MPSLAISPALDASARSLFGRLSSGSRSPIGARSDRDYTSPAVPMLASSAARRGQLTKAGRLLWDTLVAEPDNRENRLALAWVMLQRDRPLEALALIDEALVERPEDLDAAERKAFILIQLRRLGEALDLYSALLATRPDNPPLLVARGQILLALGHHEAAIADYRDAIRVMPLFGAAWWALANARTNQLSSGDIATMRALLAHGRVPRASQINLEFALGKALEEAGVFDQSFAHYRNGNELQSVGAFPARSPIERHVRQSIELLDSGHFARRDGVESDAPIFIVGMPRSGSTLVEQILASHPDIEGTAELPTVPALVRSLGEALGRSDLEYVDLLDGYSAESRHDLGQRYIEQASAYRLTDQRFFIDKMPSNWMHVGFIRAILPRARIIDVRRDPLDCCFSNYAQNFPRGHEFTNKLEDLAAHYRDYLRLMDHIECVAPGEIIRVQYEKLVEAPEQSIRTLLARLGLPFASGCLRFFANDRPVQTPSAQQVRRPLNRAGIGRAKHFEQWLGPLKRGLPAAG